ncbi:MAG: hypothetical protein LBK53_06910 [Heliobacteriaceae bacterium]|jgi:hypothetical protein|nr:hypothetical protein [Heliobacteriaceae bacterium]
MFFVGNIPVPARFLIAFGAYMDVVFVINMINTNNDIEKILEEICSKKSQM